MNKYFFIVIIVLLTSVVGYLALNRNDKVAEQEHLKQFKAKFLK